MKEQKPKAHPVVRAYVDYWLRKACKDLKVKRADFKAVSIDYTTRGFIHLWFHQDGDGKTETIMYTVDGKRV